MNTVKTGILLAALTLILVYGGQLIAGQQGMTIALVMAALMNLGAYFWSDKIALAMSGARPVTPDQAPRLYAIVERLCAKTGLPMPRLYVIPQAQPNAFATGRSPSKAAVAATAGLLEAMDDEELEGVLAHELAHVRNRDTLIMSVAATLAGAITYLAHLGQFALLFGGYGGRDRNGNGNALGALLMIILAPLAALLVQLAISRQREYAADAAAAQFVGHPYGLARALEKLGTLSKRVPMRGVEPSTAHLYIVNPFSGGALASLFSTHPPLEERIQRLLNR
ncbi:MAG: zinc metalloprotease HtpX [Acidobacteria bacterium]|nr:zinc metalloprotease HtpX [Acidobacteriota bacterium]